MENNDINNLNRSFQESYIHYNPNRVDYTINDQELNSLEDGGSNFWKDIFFVNIGICIPTLLNAYFNYTKSQNWNNEIFFNSLVGFLTLVLSILSSILWIKTNKKISKLIKEIKNRPRYRI